MQKRRKIKTTSYPLTRVTQSSYIIQLHSRYGRRYKNEGKNWKNGAISVWYIILYKNIFSIRPNGSDGSSKATKTTIADKKILYCRTVSRPFRLFPPTVIGNRSLEKKNYAPLWILFLCAYKKVRIRMGDPSATSWRGRGFFLSIDISPSMYVHGGGHRG